MEHNIAVIQKSETERIKLLKHHNILDTPPDGSFDKITHLAAKLLNVPIALVSLVDTDRIWFKSRFGLDITQIPHDPGLCASAILSDEIYLVEDARKDPRTLANPLVAGEFGLQFYAAVPLKMKEGHNLGTLCILDKAPRQLTEAEIETLQDLAEIVIAQMELRLEARTAIFNQNQILSIYAHDLKNPLTSIIMAADLIKEESNTSQAIIELCQHIIKAGGKTTRIINELLESTRMEANNIQLRFAKINYATVVNNVVITNQILANKKNQTLQLSIETNAKVLADENKLIDIVDNLINNAIKYSPADTTITVKLKEKNSQVILEVADQGPGLTEEDKENLFKRFSRLSARPTAGESSTGLGLSIVKVFTEAHNGIVWAESEGKGKGAKFIVVLPACK